MKLFAAFWPERRAGKIPHVTKDRIGIIGSAVAVVIACVQLLPPFIGADFPLWFFLGAGLYLPFGFLGLVVKTEQAKKRRKWFWVFRLILVGVFSIYLMANAPR